MVVFNDGSVQLSAELLAMIPGLFTSKAGFLEQNFKSLSPGMIVSCSARFESNVLELRGDWETLKKAHDILENWMEEQISALCRGPKDEEHVANADSVAGTSAVGNTAESPDKQLIKSSPVKTANEVTLHISNVPDISNDLKEETMSPEKSKTEDHSCLSSSSLTEIPEGGSADTKCSNEIKLCKKRKRVTPHHATPRLGMNLRKRMVGTVVSQELKEEEQQNDAVGVNSGGSGDIGEDIVDPDWMPEKTHSKGTTSVTASDDKNMEDIQDKDKVNITSKKVVKKCHSDNEMCVQQMDVSEDHIGFNPTPVKCQCCTYTTNSKRNLRHHMRRKHLERTFKCTECDKAFGLGKDLREHMRSHSKQVTCDVCGKKFTRNYFLQKHFANKHVTKKDKPEKVTKPQKKPEKPLVYGCKQCEYIGKTARNLRNHETRTHGEKTLPCPTCDKTFAMVKDLNQHVRTHTQRFCCETCGKVLKSKFALQLHRNSIHLGIKNTYVKHYLCTICGKLCNNKTVYREHQNKEHLGVRPFACEICGVAFFAKSSLRVHRRIHSDVRSHMCDICGKAFKGTQSLRLHQNIHRQWRPHKCEECDKKFTQKGALVRHMRIHTGERPFKCRLCSASFNDYSILRRHLMGIHKLTDGKYQRRCNVGDATEEKACVVPADAVETATTLSSIANTAVYAVGDLVSTNSLPMMASTQELSDMTVSVSVAGSLQCGHQTDITHQQLPQLSLPTSQGTHAAMLQSPHDHAVVMHSVHSDELQPSHYGGLMTPEANHDMGVVTVSIQDNGQVVTAARLQPELNQQLTAAVQEAAHTLVHDVGRVSLTQLPPPHLTLGQSHGLGLPVRLLPGMLPDLQAPQTHSQLMTQQDMGTQGVHPQMCTSKMLGRDPSLTENCHLHLM